MPENRHPSDLSGRVDLLIFIGLIAVAVLLNVKLEKYRLAKQASLLLGAAMGGILFAADPQYITHTMKFNSDLFFYVLIPPLLFTEAFTMHKRHFFTNVATAALLGFLGTVISIFGIGLLTFEAARAGWISRMSKNNPTEALTLGAVLSSADGSDLFEVQENPHMYSLLFGESVLNDPTTIVLFTALKKIAPPDDKPDYSVADGFATFGDFLRVLALSTVVGAAAGIFASVCLRRLERSSGHNTNVEITFMFLSAYAGYVASEVLDLSGAVSIFVTAILLAQYTFTTITRQAQITVAHLGVNMAFLAETIVFVYIGLTSFMLIKDIQWSEPQSILITFAICLVVRATCILLLSGVVNAAKMSSISWKEQVALILAGQYRGSICFAMALSTKTIHRDSVISTSVTLVGAALVLLEPFSQPLWRILAVTKEPRSKLGSARLSQDSHEEENVPLVGSLAGPGWEVAPHAVVHHGEALEEEMEVGEEGMHALSSSILMRMWKNIDRFVMRPLLGTTNNGGMSPRAVIRMSRDQEEQPHDDLPSTSSTSNGRYAQT